MKSFQLRIAQNFIAVDNDPGVQVRTWGTVGQYFWTTVFTPGGNDSLYDLQGFKNIDIYGVACNGYVIGNFNSANQCAVVQDWNFLIGINGTPSLVSGFVRNTPNGFNLREDVNLNYLSKNTNYINLASPMMSVKSINFYSIYAQGVGAEFLNEIALNYGFIFTFYYKYEGED